MLNLNENLFLPKLLKVEASADMMAPGEDFLLTVWWQNAGGKAADKQLSCFLEMELGHQRLAERCEKFYRKYWTPYPETFTWKTGDVWKTTCFWNFAPHWCGTFKINLGICGDDRIPLEFIGDNGSTVTMQSVGEIDLSWGWGTPSVHKAQKPWVKNFNDATIRSIPEKTYETALIADAASAAIRKDMPVLESFKIGEASFSFNNGNPHFILYKDNQRLSAPGNGFNIKSRLKHIEKNCAVYSNDIFYKDEKIAGAELVFSIIGEKLRAATANIWDNGEIELLEIHVPELISSFEEQTYMIDFFNAGRVIPLKETRPLSYCHEYTTRNAAALYNQNGILAAECEMLDDFLYVSVKENAGEKTACIGFMFVNKLAAVSNVASVQVENMHLFEVNFLEKVSDEEEWQTFAKFLRKDLKSTNRSVYERAFVYKQEMTEGAPPDDGVIKEDSIFAIKRLGNLKTVKQVKEETIKYFNILGGMPQVIYAGGFQKGGFDSNYEKLDEVEPKIGTAGEIREWINDGKEHYNAIIGFHDNFDDINEPDHESVCIDENGKPWKGWIWAGGLVYIISPHKYISRIKDRVQRLVDEFGIHKSYHLDVLTSEIRRFDYRSGESCSAYKSHTGKIAVVDEFNKHGIDLTSEVLNHPFVGKVGLTYNVHDGDWSLFQNDRAVPLTYMVYHGTVTYCCFVETRTQFLKSIIKGGRYTTILSRHLGDDDIKWIYLQTMPMTMLDDRKMRAVYTGGNKTKVVYDENTYVVSDLDKFEYEIVVDGQTVGKNWTALVPGFENDVYLAYSVDGGIISYPLLNGMKGKTVQKAVILTSDGEGGDVLCQIKDDKIEIHAQPLKPIKISFTL